MAKWTIEETPCLSIQQLKGMENKVLRAGFGKRTPFAIEVHKSHILIGYEGGSDPQNIRMTETAVGYGKRKWFACPFCYKNCCKLYMVSGVFACRGCHDLTYTTCQLSGNRFEQLTWEVRKRQKQLGMNVYAPLFSPDYVGIDDTPTFKPKYMKQATFDRLRLELEIIQMHRVEEWIRIVR